MESWMCGARLLVEGEVACALLKAGGPFLQSGRAVFAADTEHFWGSMMDVWQLYTD